jgi:hypothetical protein
MRAGRGLRSKCDALHGADRVSGTNIPTDNASFSPEVVGGLLKDLIKRFLSEEISNIA